MSDPTPPEGVELVRAWLAGDSLECFVRAGIFEDPALWGPVLADLARYVALSLAEEEGRPVADTLRVIQEAFVQELASEPEGES